MSKIVKYIGLSSGDVLPFSTVGLENFISNECNIEDVIRALDNSTIQPHYRICVLYNDETIKYEIPEDDIKVGGSYNENYQVGQRRNISFSLSNEDNKYSAGINSLWDGTRLSLEMGIELNDLSIVWFKKGVYIISNITPSQSTSENSLAITADDKFSLFMNTSGVLTDSYQIPTGSEIKKVIKDIISMGAGDGFPFDSKEIIFNSKLEGTKTQVEISKSAGDTLGSILTELATQLSAEMFYNANGNLTVVPIDELLDDSNKSLLFSFSAEQGDFSGLSFSFPLSQIVNQVVVIGTSNNGAVYKSIAINDNPGSPLYYKRIGLHTGNIINDSNITSQYLADERAKYELRQQSIIKTSSELSIIFNPLLTVNNLISINDEYYNFNSERFLIKSISCPLDYSGTMSISITNLNNLPFLTQNAR